MSCSSKIGIVRALLAMQLVCSEISCRGSAAARNLVRPQENSSTEPFRSGNREKRISEQIISDCMTVTSEKGHYYYKASREMYYNTGGGSVVCGIYLMADPDEVIQIHFDYVDMPCENNCIVSFVDGWELNGSYFPSDEDYPRMPEERFREYCGRRRIKPVLESSQNAALIQYRVSKAGKGFSFHFTTRKNPTPCNILVDSSTYVYTLRNYGRRTNCSLLAMNPAKIQILSLTTGINSDERRKYVETGTLHNCEQKGIPDYVQIGGGMDLARYSVVVDSICGIDSIPGTITDAISCGVTKVRLVSSGNANNIVTLTIHAVKTGETTELGALCPVAPNE